MTTTIKLSRRTLLTGAAGAAGGGAGQAEPLDPLLGGDRQLLGGGRHLLRGRGGLLRGGGHLLRAGRRLLGDGGDWVAEGRDIGDPATVDAIITSCGGDPAPVRAAVADGSATVNLYDPLTVCPSCETTW